MLKFIFATIILFHGLIHFMGFAKAFGYGNITQLTKSISKPAGVFWLLTALLFITIFILFLLKKESWPALAIVAALLSQVLIITVWKDAKFGTIANAIILIISITTWGSRHFESAFIQDVKAALQRSKGFHVDLLTNADIEHLPKPVQKYLQYSNVINHPKVKNVRIVFNGEMRGKGQNWFPFRSVQFNFFDSPARLFFMKAKMFGLTVPAYHRYTDAKATMNVSIFGLIPMVKKSGEGMDKAETVTLFNDMCLLAPATLIDKRIEWEEIDSLTAKAIFTNGINKIAATLFFNNKGQLVNFISDDRFDINEKKQFRFSTPVKEYAVINGMHVMKNGDAVWHYPEGEFVYGKFVTESIEYNVEEYSE